MPYIKIISIDGKKRIIELKPKRYLIGRSGDREIQLEDPTVSRTHAEVFKFGDHYIVRDLDATNGIFVNNNKATEEILKDKDEIIIGSTLLIYQDVVDDDELNRASGDGEDIITDTFVINEHAEEKNPQGKIKYDSSHFESIEDIAETIAHVKNEKDAHSFLSEKVASLLDAQYVYLFAVSEPDRKEELKGYYSVDNKDNSYSRTIVKQAIRSREAIATSNALEDEKFSLSESIVIRRTGAVICLPFLAGRKQIVLYIQREAGREAFSQKRFEFAMTIGSILWAFFQSE